VKDVSRWEFWNERYRSGDTGWDKGAVVPPIARMLKAPVVKQGRVAVLGAGRGHEALEAAREGLLVTAIDFAPLACESLRLAAATAGLSIDVCQEDVFDVGKRHPAFFDAILEHTCFCAIDPDERSAYASAVHSALKPGGIYFGLFYAHGRPGGPPFSTSEAEVHALFSRAFDVERLVPAPDSFSGRAGEELEFVFRTRPMSL
jgi:SAM-dependent methyltransferase